METLRSVWMLSVLAFCFVLTASACFVLTASACNNEPSGNEVADLTKTTDIQGAALDAGPETLGADFSRIMSGEDCAKVAKELDAFLTTHGDRWKEYMLGRVKVIPFTGSESIVTIVTRIMADGDTALMEQLERSRCERDPSVEEVFKQKLAPIVGAIVTAIVGVDPAGDAAQTPPTAK